MWWKSRKGFLILEEITKLRTDILERTREINGVTEREVMAAAASTARIVGEATTHITQLRALLTSLDDSSGGAPRQPAAAAIESRHRPIATRIERQCEKASEAATQCTNIEAAAHEVQGLALRAKLIALNANIQAARADGPEERGFARIAMEMMELSQEIARANERVGELAGALASILPGLAAEAETIRGASEAFSLELTARVSESEADASRLRTEVGQMIHQSDAVMAHVIDASNDSLSHLQFQDTVAQGLLRMDSWLRGAQVKASEVLGLRVDEREFAAAAHVELGGEKAVDQHNAGEVVLF
ncbi:MAG: hypothetical protein Q8N23_32520 [Archangium sp.]|nr:hypothetical protein [Archangium sp.]MDP3572176.1 hypothetical protein [Archangium sp.]